MTKQHNAPRAAVQSRELSRLLIPWHDIQMGKVLGAGGFGTVYLGSWQGNRVAVKMLDKQHLSDEAREALRNEVFMMCKLRHPCIAVAYGG
jgi:serine/threonine protein kinase